MKPVIRQLLARARSLRTGAEGQPVPSPCSSICRLDPQRGWCQGCLRSLDEIAGWGGFDDAQKQAIWLRIEQRAQEAA